MLFFLIKVIGKVIPSLNYKQSFDPLTNEAVSFYWLSQVNRLTGTIEETIETILGDN
jgi:hypothetical protein